MNNILITKIFEKAEVEGLLKLIKTVPFEKNTEFYYPQSQTSSECIENEEKQAISNMILQTFSENTEFNDFVLPERYSEVLISRTDKDEHLTYHHDNPFNGHYSVTMFLSDPETYKGGELSLFSDYEERYYKLPAGTAIIYPTGTYHQVNKVTEGSRYVAVFWVTSKITNEIDRSIVTRLRLIRSYIKELGIDEKEDTLSIGEFASNPHTILQSIEGDIIRKYI
jgi:PKHD-type hydroxylase